MQSGTTAPPCPYPAPPQRGNAPMPPGLCLFCRAGITIAAHGTHSAVLQRLLDNECADNASKALTPANLADPVPQPQRQVVSCGRLGSAPPECQHRCLRGSTLLLGCGGPHDDSAQTRLARFQQRHQSGRLVQGGPTHVLNRPTRVAFVREQPRPQLAQLRCFATRKFATAEAKRVRSFPVHRSTFGAEDNGTVQRPTPRIENSSQLQAVPSKRARVEMTVLRKACGNDG